MLTISVTQFETIKRMQAYYRTVHSEDGPVSPDERRVLRNAMIDYGALQPSPVQSHSKEAQQIEREPIREVCLHQLPPFTSCILTTFQSMVTGPQLVSPPSTTPLANNGSFFDSGQTYHSYNDMNFDLDFNFDVTPAEVEAIMANAMQDFWASFPGEVGYT